MQLDAIRRFLAAYSWKFEKKGILPQGLHTSRPVCPIFKTACFTGKTYI